MMLKQSSTLLQDFLSEVLPKMMLDLTVKLSEEKSSRGALLHVEFGGSDATLLTQDNGALLLALEHVAAMALRLQPGQHELLNFDVAGFKACQARRVDRELKMAIDRFMDAEPVYHCAPLTYRERYMLHRSIIGTGVESRLIGEGPERHLVLYYVKPCRGEQAQESRRLSAQSAG